MGFYLLTRDRADGTVRLLSAEVFADREAALDVLRAMVAAGDLPDAAEATVHVADLDAAQPVLLLAPAEGPSDAEPVAAEDDGPAGHEPPLEPDGAGETAATGATPAPPEPQPWMRVHDADTELTPEPSEAVRTPDDAVPAADAPATGVPDVDSVADAPL